MTYEEPLNAVVAEAERHDQLEVVVRVRCRRGHEAGRVVKVDGTMLYASLLLDAPATKAFVQLAKAAQRSGGRVGDAEFRPQGPVEPQYRRGVTARARGIAPPVPLSADGHVEDRTPRSRTVPISQGWLYALPRDAGCPDELPAWTNPPPQGSLESPPRHPPRCVSCGSAEDVAAGIGVCEWCARRALHVLELARGSPGAIP